MQPKHAEADEEINYYGFPGVTEWLLAQRRENVNVNIKSEQDKEDKEVQIITSKENGGSDRDTSAGNTDSLYPFSKPKEPLSLDEYDMTNAFKNTTSTVPEDKDKNTESNDKGVEEESVFEEKVEEGEGGKDSGSSQRQHFIRGKSSKARTHEIQMQKLLHKYILFASCMKFF